MTPSRSTCGRPAGVIYWDDLDGLSEPIEVEFKGKRYPAEVNRGYLFAVFWDSLDPANYIEPDWPEVVRY